MRLYLPAMAKKTGKSAGEKTVAQTGKSAQATPSTKPVKPVKKRASKSPLRETDLYPPLREWLQAQGYQVHAEVGSCDVLARKADPADAKAQEALIAIELKLRPTVELLIQATNRQALTESVYVALPPPGPRHSAKLYKGFRRLLRQLEIGLLWVDPARRLKPVDLEFHPLAFQRKKSGARRRAVLVEMAGRSGDWNSGGSSGRKLMTAYRETAIYLACCLELQGPASPKTLRALGTGPKTLSILAGNVYGWFERVDRGLYGLTAAGVNGLSEWPEAVSLLRARIPGHAATDQPKAD